MPNRIVRRHPLVLSALLSLALGSVSDVASAQPARRSQLGTISQIIADARVEIVYRRPVARGRALFGALVPWGAIWSPSADSSARLTTSGPIEINGSPLPAGTYGIWAIPDSSAWTIVFSRVPYAFHLRYPAGQDALRVRAVPTTGEHVETLAFQFPVVDADSAVLQLRWGTTVVPLSIRAR